jgi:hypothetical protein
MPAEVGKCKNGSFKYLRDRIWKHIQGWMEQILSQGGKEVLIKSVALAIPTFSMSCFKLPRGLCQYLDSVIRSFWWGSKDGKRKVAWVSWDVLTMPSTWVAWDSKIWSYSIYHFWQNRHGAFIFSQKTLPRSGARV